MPPRKAKASSSAASSPAVTPSKAATTTTTPKRNRGAAKKRASQTDADRAVATSGGAGLDVEAVDLNLETILSRPVDVARALLYARRYYVLVAGLLAAANFCLGVLVILKVPYTKIDWPAYMQQVDMFLAGETDYSKIEGETGPLVYPALHLYLYAGLHWLLPSSGRERPAQWIFLFVELFTFLLVATIYYLAGRPKPLGKHVPQWLLIPLVLSKRSHSIYLLRLFNDPLAMLFLYASVVLFQLEYWKIASIVWALALGVKMNILLFLPGLIVILFQRRGFFGVVDSVVIFFCVQIALPAFSFFETREETAAYFQAAFNFGRQFLYEWTVNWKFVPEKTFLSTGFSMFLINAHAATLVAFGLFRWSPFPGGVAGVLRRGLGNLKLMFVPPVARDQMSSEHIPLVLFTSNLIGMTFARSLHYQFHAWYFHQLPMLLYFGIGRGAPIVLLGCMALLERAWDTFPSTPGSSRTMLFTHIGMLAGLWFLGPKPPPAAASVAGKKKTA